MSTDRETTRVVRSWLDEGVTKLPDRVLDLVLDQVPATPQRRSGWSAWRSYRMNIYVKLAVAAAAVLVVAVVGYQFLPGRPGVGGQPTPSPSPSPLAAGSFTSHGIAGEIDARGGGANVTGTLSASDSGLDATVTLECSRTAEDGLLIIGGLVTQSTFQDNFPEGRRVAIIFQRGSPVKAVWWIALLAEPPVASCDALVDDIIKQPDLATNLEPIGGSVVLN